LSSWLASLSLALFVLLPQRLGCRDIRLLALFCASAEQHDKAIAIPAEVHT